MTINNGSIIFYMKKGDKTMARHNNKHKVNKKYDILLDEPTWQRIKVAREDGLNIQPFVRKFINTLIDEYEKNHMDELIHNSIK
jgi:hypothetical protein